MREAEQTPQPSVVLAFCLSGAPDRADQVLARLTGLSEELFENQCVHSLQWYDAARGDLHTRQVEDEESFRRVLLEACSSPLSERELRVEDCRKELRAPRLMLAISHSCGWNFLMFRRCQRRGWNEAGGSSGAGQELKSRFAMPVLRFCSGAVLLLAGLYGALLCFFKRLHCRKRKRR